MNRIYQGRVTRVETLKTRTKGAKADDWTELGDWNAALWRHHELFQDAVNYWFLLFAALAEATPTDDPLARFRVRIRDEIWNSFRGPRAAWETPFTRVTQRVTGRTAASFDEVVHALFTRSGTTSTERERATAVLALFAPPQREKDGREKDQDAKGLFPRAIKLCAPPGTDRNASDSLQAKTRLDAQAASRRIAADPEARLSVDDPYNFKTQPRRSTWTHQQALRELRKRFNKTAKRHATLELCRANFEVWLSAQPDSFAPAGPAGKQWPSFNSALIFAHYPCPETRAAFLADTDELRSENVAVPDDPFQRLRGQEDRPVFPFFTELAMNYPAGSQAEQLPFRDFEKAAFVEAFNKVNQFCRAERERVSRLQKLAQMLSAFETTGGLISQDDPEDVSGTVPGFSGDRRIALIRELVATLGDGERESYSIGRRSLKAFEDVRNAWSALPADSTAEQFVTVVRSLQKTRKESFGAGELFEALALDRWRPIWQTAGSAGWHSSDVLRDWCRFEELREEIADLSEPSNFTPAHSSESPRYFRWSETENKEHLKWDGLSPFLVRCRFLACTSDPTAKSDLVEVQMHYRAPRMIRDGLRQPNESLDEDNPDLPWLHQLARAQPKLAQHAPKQTFAGTAVRLVPSLSDGCELVLEPALNAESWQDLWADWKNHNFHRRKVGSEWINIALKWPPAGDGAKPGWMQRKIVRVLSLDFGLRHGAAYAVLHASPTSGGIPVATPAGEITPPGYFQSWATTRSGCGVVRLPGEDTEVWRATTDNERKRGESSAGFHEELSGSRGRLADCEESAEAKQILSVLCRDGETLGSLSRFFCEQSDTLLREAKRAGWAIRQLYRWGWLLQNGRTSEVAEARSSFDASSRLGRWTSPLPAEIDASFFAKLGAIAKTQLAELRTAIAMLMNRVVRHRGKSWTWAITEAGFWQLREVDEAARRRLKLRGMRGLSLDRIEQVQRLRQLAQSAAKLSRREFGKPAERLSDAIIPDVAPRTLEMLEELREQRAKQLAHAILAEALGVRLAPPPPNKQDRKRSEDLHGIYEPIRGRDPVDFIVVENLAAFRTSALQSRRANRQLARWCKAKTLDLLEEMVEPFGIPLVHVDPAFTSRLCSRTGVLGFRAREVDLAAAREELDWSEKSCRSDTTEWRRLVRNLEDAAKTNPGMRMLAPKEGGSKFIPLVGDPTKKLGEVATHADINAATCIGLRALAHPDALRAPIVRFVVVKNPRARKGRASASSSLSEKPAMKRCLFDWSRLLHGETSEPAPLIPANGKAIDKSMQPLVWPRCHELNETRMAREGIAVSRPSIAPDDDIKM